MKRIYLLAALCFFFVETYANQPFTITKTLQWESPEEYALSENKSMTIFDFKDAAHDDLNPTLPVFYKRFPLESNARLKVEWIATEYAPLEKALSRDMEALGEEIKIKAEVQYERKRPFGFISFVPIRKNPTTGDWEKLVSFEMRITPVTLTNTTSVYRDNTTTSVLSDGVIYKFSVKETGVYKLTYDFLKNDLGITNLDNIDPRNIQILGNGGGLLPEKNADFRYDDVQENPIVIQGESDGTFNSGDYILFYGESHDKWSYNASNQSFEHQTHIYDDNNYYFLKIATEQGKRITTRSSLANSDYSTSSGDAFQHYEENSINLLDLSPNASGSGKEWYDVNSFEFTTERSYDFAFSNLIFSEPIQVVVAAAGRSTGAGSSFTVKLNSTVIGSVSMISTGGGINDSYARKGTSSLIASTSSNTFPITLNYNRPNSTAKAWLNYITINARQNLNFGSGQFSFRDQLTIGNAATQYTVSNAASNVTIWDVTDITNVVKQGTVQVGNQQQFTAPSTELHEFIAFDGSQYLTATAGTAISNQNIHGLETPNFVIVYHPDFQDAATTLAEHRRTHSGMTVETISLPQIYNEFASGKTDLTAIRDMARMFYDRSDEFKYLLLLGDASFDYKNIMQNPSNTNFVPTFESFDSEHPINSYPTDDYFGLLDENEGGVSSGALDIGVGRIPAKTATEAALVMEKIIHYDANSATYGDWKNRITFVADDEDGNLHIKDADGIASMVANEHHVYNLDKVYFDAFPQESLSAGQRYPEVTSAINRNIFKGNFVMNYMGHGTDDGWAQERVLTIPDMNTWNNKDNLPLFITATCSFGPYEDPNIVSAGELLCLKPNGGSIALYTTVRAVYASSNRQLTTAVFNNVFELFDNERATLGQILSKAKNTGGASTTNSRKFTLLGDPSLILAYPEYDVATTSINSNPVTNGVLDTLQALQEVTITGRIADGNGATLTNFNGIVYPTVFDKVQSIATRGNDEGSPIRNFDLQKSILFKGRASVVNGEFTYSFTMPIDIDYQYGIGKISYYADNGSNMEARGFHEGIIIGGTDTSGVADDNPPVVEVFMNTEEFVFGGTTNSTPTLLIKLSDDLGINTASSGIGHDITGVLDENTQNTYVLNDFYESELNNAKAGVVNYPLDELAPGLHTIKVKAWDVANNPGEGYTEFLVADDANIALDHVLNYPNPFTTHTEFQFEHNQLNQNLKVQVQIFTVSGQLIKTIEQEIFADGILVKGIEWDGTDEYGDRIGVGVYVYKVAVGTIGDEGITNTESKFEKLVILR